MEEAIKLLTLPVDNFVDKRSASYHKQDRHCQEKRCLIF